MYNGVLVKHIIVQSVQCCCANKNINTCYAYLVRYHSRAPDYRMPGTQASWTALTSLCNSTFGHVL